MWPGIITKTIKTWCSNLACPYLPRASQQCSVVTVSTQAKKHTRTTYLESQKAAGIFFFIDYVALNFLQGEMMVVSTS
jgi:hypothetical protein